MRLGWFGGLLIIGSAAFFMAAAAVALTGGSVSVSGAGLGGLAITAALALLGSGAGLLALGGSEALRGRTARIGLGLVAVGLLATLATSTAAPDSVLVIVFLVGGLVGVLGVVVTAIALLLTPGPCRRTGLLLLAGVVVLVLAMGVANATRSATGGQTPALVAGALALIGLIALIGGLVSLGRLGLGRTQVIAPVSA